jgi:nucleoid-associated protein YgaU
MKPSDNLNKGKLEELKKEAGPKVTAEHTVAEGDTLHKIALKYYGDGSRKHYMYIYNKNKDVIGNDPDMINVGMKLKIYELAEGL